MTDESAEKRAAALEGRPVNAKVTALPGARVLTGETGAALAEPTPPVPWMCRELHLAPGRPMLMQSGAGSGKTWVVMDIALGIAAGAAVVLGAIPSQCNGHPLPVVHLNYEMPRYEVRRRYQRLARGRGYNIGKLPIHVMSKMHLGSFYLNDPKARAILVATLKALGQAGLVVIDSLRAAVSGLDENKTEIRAPLDTLLAVSDETGWTFIVIHHEGKPDPDGKRETIHRARGSSGIVDACDTTWSLVPQSHSWRLEMGKASHGSRSEPFNVRLNDTGGVDPNTDKSEGVQFELLFPEQMAEIADRVPPAIDRAREAIRAALLFHGELTSGQIEKSAKFVKGDSVAKGRARRMMQDDGEIVAGKGGTNEKKWRLFALPGTSAEMGRTGAP